MKLSVPNLLAKIGRHRPRMVCFVGKNIWDKFEDIIKKSCDPPETEWKRVMLTDIGMNDTKITKRDSQERDCQPLNTDEHIAHDGQAQEVYVKQETQEDNKPIPPPLTTVPPPLVNVNAARRLVRPAKEPFDWTQPRPYKLVHRDSPSGDGEPTEPQVTLFWVVPSTSGLERTPVSFCLHEIGSLWGILLPCGTLFEKDGITVLGFVLPASRPMVVLFPRQNNVPNDRRGQGRQGNVSRNQGGTS